MSVVIPRSMLSDELAKFLRKALCFKSEKTNVYNFSDLMIYFYHMSSTNNYSLFLDKDVKDKLTIVEDKVKMLFLPYAYGKLLMEQQGLTRFLLREYPVIDIKFTGQLRDYQTSIVSEARDQLNKYNTTSVHVPVGKGKTVIAAMLSCDYKQAIAVIYPRTKLGTQWKNTFEKYTNAKCWIVGEKPVNEANVILCLDRRTKDLPEAYKRMFGVLILDESHMLCTQSHIESLLCWTPSKIISLSATPKRLDGMDIMIKSMCGDHCVVREEDRVFSLIKVNTGVSAKREIKNNRVCWSVLIQSLLYNDFRNSIIVDIANNPNRYLEDTKAHKIIILTSEKKHVKLLHSLIPDSDFLCGTKNEYTNKRVLISLFSKLSTGFDESSSCKNFEGSTSDILIICSSIKNETLLIQSTGRVFRNGLPTIIHFCDNDSIVMKHFGICKKWYRSKGAMFKEVSFEKIDPVNLNQ